MGVLVPQMETCVRKGGETKKSVLSRDRLNTDRLSVSSPPTPHIQLPECPCPRCPTGLDFPELRASGWRMRVPGSSIPGAHALTQAFPGQVSGSILPEFLALASGTTCPALLTFFKVTAPGTNRFLSPRRAGL